MISLMLGLLAHDRLLCTQHLQYNAKPHSALQHCPVVEQTPKKPLAQVPPSVTANVQCHSFTAETAFHPEMTYAHQRGHVSCSVQHSDPDALCVQNRCLYPFAQV